MSDLDKVSMRPLSAAPEGVVRGSGAGYSQEILAGPHHLSPDEPIAAGGTDKGPGPYDLLLAALRACTFMTVGMYARRRSWPLEEIVVRLRHSKTHAEDSTECETKEGILEHIDREL